MVTRGKVSQDTTFKLKPQQPILIHCWDGFWTFENRLPTLSKDARIAKADCGEKWSCLKWASQNDSIKKDYKLNQLSGTQEACDLSKDKKKCTVREKKN